MCTHTYINYVRVKIAYTNIRSKEQSYEIVKQEDFDSTSTLH